MAALPASADSHTVRPLRRRPKAAAPRLPAAAARHRLRLPAARSQPPLSPTQAELAFDGAAYIITARCVGGDCLEVVAERKDDASAWGATFAAKCERVSGGGGRRLGGTRGSPLPALPTLPTINPRPPPTTNVQTWRRSRPRRAASSASRCL